MQLNWVATKVITLLCNQITTQCSHPVPLWFSSLYLGKLWLVWAEVTANAANPFLSAHNLFCRFPLNVPKSQAARQGIMTYLVRLITTGAPQGHRMMSHDSFTTFLRVHCIFPHENAVCVLSLPKQNPSNKLKLNTSKTMAILVSDTSTPPTEARVICHCNRSLFRNVVHMAIRSAHTSPTELS